MNNLNIYIESNPNPNSLKFVTNVMLVDEGIVKDYPDIQSAEDSPLAKKLFDLHKSFFGHSRSGFFNESTEFLSNNQSLTSSASGFDTLESGEQVIASPDSTIDSRGATNEVEVNLSTGNFSTKAPFTGDKIRSVLKDLQT